MAKLLVHESAGVRDFEIVDNEVHMGRELDNTLRLPDPSISRHHCVVRKVGGGYEIQDLQSSNGVLVNGNRVQASPLHHGDRITLGQIQLTFEDPKAEPDATVAISALEAAPPLGTVRMSADQLAAIHLGRAPEEAAPAPTPAMTLDTVPAPDPSSTSPVATPAKSPIPPIAPPPAPRPMAVANPEASFLGNLLPTIPDQAQATGQRGELGERLLAVLIDVVPSILISIVFGVLSVIPFVGCVLLPLSFLVQMAYIFFFVPWTVSKYGASIGKKAMKLRVIPLGQPAGHLDLGPAILRQFGNILALNLIVLAVKGEERISLSDIIATSEVIKVDR